MFPVTLGLQTSFGFGDRTGLATPGHVAAMQLAGEGIQPIFAQQSIREMVRCKRNAQEVLEGARKGMVEMGWQGVTGADADHLKTRDDVDQVFDAYFTFYTIDSSEHCDEDADDYDLATLKTKFAAIESQIEWLPRYRDQKVKLPNGTVIDMEEEAVLRAAVKYGRAINATVDIANYIRAKSEAAGRDFEIELAIDETRQVTSLAEHYIFAQQLLERNVKLVSLAPRFIGNFEKGVDYMGDMDELEASIRDHNAIADALGPYKLSLHSGSDKLSIYTLFARATRGRFHVKTSGTSYVEALRVVCRHDPALFRDIVNVARRDYAIGRATYNLHANLEDVPAPSEITDNKELERVYLQLWEETPEGLGFTAAGRQIVHCTYGSVLPDPELGPKVHACLLAHPETYKECLSLHFRKHIQALRAGMP